MKNNIRAASGDIPEGRNERRVRRGARGRLWKVLPRGLRKGSRKTSKSWPVQGGFTESGGTGLLRPRAEKGLEFYANNEFKYAVTAFKWNPLSGRLCDQDNKPCGSNVDKRAIIPIKAGRIMRYTVFHGVP